MDRADDLHRLSAPVHRRRLRQGLFPNRRNVRRLCRRAGAGRIVRPGAGPVLGSLAVWVGVCTFASQRVRSWANYGCVLAGYTAAIVGIPAALVPANAFYYANARFTEICLASSSARAWPACLCWRQCARSLKDALAEARRSAVRYVASVLNGVDASKRAGRRGRRRRLRRRAAELLAVFERRPTRQAGERIRGFAGALVERDCERRAARTSGSARLRDASS